MPKLRRLSGDDLLRILSRFGFHPISQRGSHVKVRRTLPGGIHQTLTVALHDELDKGTTRAIYRQALRFIAELDLQPYFYSE
jgi:predicted RNA binding protein YcfA (HicA-like mRNA interferase family)